MRTSLATLLGVGFLAVSMSPSCGVSSEGDATGSTDPAGDETPDGVGTDAARSAGTVASADASCSAGLDVPAEIGVYEWREEGWREAGPRAALLEAASALCLDRVLVDVTGAATADDGVRDALADDLITLVGEAAAGGVSVGAVAGDPWWPSDDGVVDAMRVVDFIDRVDGPDHRLAALHLDVEPWGLDEWSEDRIALTLGHLDFVRAVEAHRASIGLDVPVAYLVPYWFDGGNGEAPMVELDGRSAFPLDHLAGITGPGSALVVMAYRQRALGDNGIVALLAEELDRSAVPVIVAVETAEVEPDTITFAGLGPDDLERELGVVVASTGVTDIVINDIPGLLALHGRGDTID